MRTTPEVRLGVLACGFLATGIGAVDVRAGCEDVPLRSDDATQMCTYPHVAFGVFTYVGDRLSVDWGPDAEVVEAFLLADWEKVGPVRPNAPFVFRPDPSKGRYDVVVQLRRPADGTEMRAISPLWCAERPDLMPAPATGCSGFWTTSSCTLTESVTCDGATPATVTCEGDGGSCSGGLLEDGVGCSSTRTVVDWGTHRATSARTTLIRKAARCPVESASKEVE